jgi:hypothetical protein
VLRFIRPDLYLAVLSPANPDFKASAREYLKQADGVILDQPPDMLEMAQSWNDVSLKVVAGKPVFRICPPDFVTGDLIDFVRQRLEEGAGGVPANPPIGT